jgi:hypothetical protein
MIVLGRGGEPGQSFSHRVENVPMQRCVGIGPIESLPSLFSEALPGPMSSITLWHCAKERRPASAIPLGP